MSDPIHEYLSWKRQGDELRSKAKQAIELRYRQLLQEAAQLAEEYRSDFGATLKNPPGVTSFRYKPGLKRAATKKSGPKAATKEPATAKSALTTKSAPTPKPPTSPKTISRPPAPAPSSAAAPSPTVISTGSVSTGSLSTGPVSPTSATASPVIAKPAPVRAALPKATAASPNAGKAPAAKPELTIALLQKRLDNEHKKLEAAKAKGIPTRNIEDRIYEIEDDLRLASLKAGG